ncbi:hypothetical protein ES703_24872 [subsurface metagenome]
MPNFNKMDEEKRIKEILRKNKKPLDAEDISKKTGDNVFIINKILRNFEKKGLVIAQ